jgi:predicted Fe-Mo cluster-binding NifX family protein
MLVCLPTNADAGAADTICDHFGSAPFFTLYDSDTDQFTILPNQNSGHRHGTCHPLSQLQEHKIDGVVCKGMGRRAIDMLASQDIKVYLAGSGRVADAVAKIKAGELPEIDPAQACRGHGHGQGRGAGGCGR